MKNATSRYTSFALIGLLAIVFPALASYDGMADSVHFYSQYEVDGKVDFGRAPMSVRMIGWNNEATRDGSINTSDWNLDEPSEWDSGWIYQQNRLRTKARNLEVAGRFQEALKRFRMLTPVEGLAAFTRDREEVLAAAKNKDSQVLQQYLRGRFLLQFGDSRKGVSILREIKNAPEFLKANLQYAIASALETTDRSAMSEAYLSAYWSYRKSPRAESALIMAARVLLQVGPGPKPTPDEIAKADRILERLLAEFPKTRFSHNALGWKGRCAFLRGKMDIAAAIYTKQSRSENADLAWEGFSSLAYVCEATKRRDALTLALLKQWGLEGRTDRHLQGAYWLMGAFESLSPEEARVVQTAIRKDSALLETYVGFRIEHTYLTPKQEENLMAFATTTLTEMKSPPTGLVSRVAQINYNAGRYASARLLAQKAVRLSGDREAVARARYVLAGSLSRLGHHKQAIREAEKLIHKTTPGYLRHGAAEFLALEHERHGDPLRSLDLYIGLGYEYDAAFLADAKLSPEQLKSYLKRKPRYASRSLRSRPEYSSFLSGYVQNKSGEPTKAALQYTLGMRYLRQERYSEARQAFLKIDKQTRTNWGMTPKKRKELPGDDGEFYYDVPPKVQDPLIIVAKLESLTRRATRARTDDAKAQAIYDKAAFIYRERNLLFYSPALWQGQRAFMFDMWWNPEINSAADKSALDRHLNEHECLAQSLRLCDEIVDKYPNSKVMPKALYTAAISAERLSNLNSTWRMRGEPLLRKAIKRLDRLTKDYPSDPLFKSATKYKGEFAKQLAKPTY